MMAELRLPRANKYGAKRATRGGLRFDSQAEARRYDELVLLEKAGEIEDLKRQVRYRLEVNGVHVCDYVADFTYVRFSRPRQRVRVVEDCKGVMTREYLLKKKLMLAVYGIAIEESGRQRKARRPRFHAPPKTKRRG